MLQFTTNPVEFFRNERKRGAVAALNAYREMTGFHFDRLAQASDPNTITAQDIVAVSMLSVDVSPEASLWLLSEKGRVQVSRLLRSIDPTDIAIWDEGADISRQSPAWELWDVVDALFGMGPTKTSKLLAAKRPHLIPILDDVVREALFKGIPRREVEYAHWDVWRDALRGTAGADLREAVESVRHEAGYDQSVSVLRIIDIVVWTLNRRA
jgi:hypothetical protein